jgi:ribosomal protein S6
MSEKIHRYTRDSFFTWSLACSPADVSEIESRLSESEELLRYFYNIADERFSSKKMENRYKEFLNKDRA